MQNNKTLREKEQILRISGVNPLRCMRCGKCSATCPSYEEMEYHPHQFVYMVETGDIEPLLNSESLYKCLSCFACVERCPRGVEPAKLVEAIRLIKIRQKDRLAPAPSDFLIGVLRGVQPLRRGPLHPQQRDFSLLLSFGHKRKKEFPGGSR